MILAPERVFTRKTLHTGNKQQELFIKVIHLNTLMFFDQYWAKGKLAYLSFYKKEERVQLSFWTILFLMT